MIELMAITRSPDDAALWTESGVDRIMVDLEVHDKARRQASRDTVISNHTIDDLRRVRRGAPFAHVVARTDPVEAPNWHASIEAILRCRPDTVMLPMARDGNAVRELVTTVAGRAHLIVMVETAPAIAAAEDFLSVAPEATLFVGLNDLHVSLKQRFLFEPLADGTVESIAATAHRRGSPFGFGGLARPGRGHLDSALIVGEHVRLGSTLAILGRSFFADVAQDGVGECLADAVGELRACEHRARTRSADEVAAQRVQLVERIIAVRDRVA